MPHFLCPHITVSGAAGAGVRETAGCHDELCAVVLYRLNCEFFPCGSGFSAHGGTVCVDAYLLTGGLDAVEAEPAGRYVNGFDLTVRDHFHAGKRAGSQEGIHHVSCHM